MARFIAVTACGLTLAACSMSGSSLDFFKSAPPTETLRVESEPPGADARTSQGQSCRTPCELTVPVEGEIAVSFALNGYQPQTLQVRPEASPTTSGDAGKSGGRLQPNPVYAELQPLKPPGKKKSPAKRKQTAAQKAGPAEDGASDPSPGFRGGYPWPDQQPR